MITVPIGTSSPYIVQRSDSGKVVELFAAMRHEQTRDEAPGEAGQATAGGSTGARPTPGRSMSTAAALTALPASISPSSSHFFEVLYIGKIKVSHKKVPDTFIDDALEKFRAHELEKGRGKSKGHTPQNYASDSISKEINSSYNENGSKNNENGGDNSESKSSAISASVSIPTTSSATATIPSIMTPVSGTNLNSTIGSYSSSEPVHNIIITLDNDNKTHSYPQDPKIHLNIPKSEDSTELNALSVNKTYPVTMENKETNSNEEQERQENNASNFIANSDNEKSTVAESNSQSRPHSPIQDSVLSRQFSIVMEPVRNRAASTGNAKEPKKTESTQGHSNHNRIMLFQVGRTDLHLISPDRKQILLHKHLKDVASCIQGIKHPDHFGFICRESNVECYIAYVFKCQSDSVADDVVAAITQAFMTTVDGSKREKIPVFSCEHCPMVWYHKLCSEIEGMNDKKTMTVIFRKLELLPEEEQTTILTKFQGAETNSEREQNEFLMMLLRAHCENKQARHVHDTAENRHEFLNQYLGGSTIFMKAKRSLTSSFDQLLKRKGSRDDFGPILKELSLPVNAALCKDSPSSGCSSPNSRVSPASEHPETIESGIRRRSSTVGSVCGETMKKELFSKQNSAGVSPSTSQQHLPSVPNTPPNGHQLVHQKSSPMMNIFFKVGNTPKTSPSEENHDVIRQSGSWRQAIFNRVVTPNKTQVNGYSIKSESRKKDKSELRALWKKAINQQLLLIRMEKENAKLRAHQEEATVKRIKLEYEEISPCMREVVEVWDLLISKESRITAKCDTQMLLQAIKQGVPRSKRGEVWQFLAEQHCLKMPPLDTSQFPNYNVPYETLLKQLTCHPHNILVDLGRTFPGHTYFASPLGPGQLALFNLLKAYSLLDPEVGYCQGLNFVAGVLLLHMSEDCAFFLLKHLMFRRGLRRQYLPDMAALQVQLYQLSRLLHDLHPDLYIHFDNHEVAPTLYAAPWILTVFASQFPLGFVTRVFDLIFLESPEVIFRVALALLGEHKDGLLACDNFEEIMDYLKIRIPNIDKTVLDKIMKMVFTMDITKQLHEYEVEYHVLQEEMASPRPEYEDLHRLEEANKLLTQQNQHLSEQLEIATNNIQRLETSRTLQQGSINRFESQVRSLEVSILTMGNFILNLAETRSDIEIPGEIRRLITHLSTTEQRRNSTFSKQSLLSSLNTKGVPLKVIDTGETYIKHCASHEKSVTNGNIISPNAKQSRGTPYPLKSTLSSPNLSAKLTSMSSFFGNVNNSVKQQKSTAKHKVENNLVLGPSDTKQLEYKETSKIEETLSVSVKSHCAEIDPLTKSMSLSSSKSIPKLRATQSSFELTTNKSKIEECIKQNESGDHVHPLDSCLGVNFSYGGTTKLKTIRPLRAQLTRHISSDSLQQKTDETTPIIVPNSYLLTGSSTESENESQSLPSITQPKSKTTLLSR